MIIIYSYMSIKSEEYYVYIYLDPFKSCKLSYNGIEFSFLYEPFYVGKGKKYRCLTHLQNYKLKKNTNLSNRINEIRKNGIDPFIIRAYEKMNEIDSMKFERKLISIIGKISTGGT